ncbi:hypothetical protein NBZ79_07020 [Sneathiella marina]|uniref:Uncharacterized protein n=1 Tax=Sneathiella marina TaxID=2950108 RepID=A0ABY4W6D2_9PROT|nr:hypothetical protein [Sneathiella marina]USG62727.1 hypothetical protein NBZ79_07020 [Sneathiella marina]
MSKNFNALTENSNRKPKKLSDKIRVRPFKSRLLAELISEFESRNATGGWCGYAMLDAIPEALHCCIETKARNHHNPLCTVMFLKGSNAQNYLLRSEDHGYVLLGQDLRILHSGASLSDALDMVQIRCYRN